MKLKHEAYYICIDYSVLYLLMVSKTCSLKKHANKTGML